jgi:hypothetical protein
MTARHGLGVDSRPDLVSAKFCLRGGSFRGSGKLMYDIRRGGRSRARRKIKSGD